MKTPKLTLALPFLALLFPALALAGSQTYTTPGTYTFTVPEYTGTLTVTAIGGGGGGGGGAMGADTFPGGNGGKAGDVSFGSVVAKGGLGGCGGAVTNPYSGGSFVTGRGGSTPVLVCSQRQSSGVAAVPNRGSFTDSGAGTASGGDTNVTGGGASRSEE